MEACRVSGNIKYFLRWVHSIFWYPVMRCKKMRRSSILVLSLCLVCKTTVPIFHAAVPWDKGKRIFCGIYRVRKAFIVKHGVTLVYTLQQENEWKFSSIRRSRCTKENACWSLHYSLLWLKKLFSLLFSN